MSAVSVALCLDGNEKEVVELAPMLLLRPCRKNFWTERPRNLTWLVADSVSADESGSDWWRGIETVCVLVGDMRGCKGWSFLNEPNASGPTNE